MALLYVKEIVDHKIGDNTPFDDIAASLGWTTTIEEENTEKAWDGSLWEKGYAPAKPQKVIDEQRIYEIKDYLDKTDYVVIKIAEGTATQEEYAEVLATRKAYREEMQSLEDAIISE